MANLIYEITDAALTENADYQYNMSLVLSSDACSFLVHNAEKLLTFRYFTFQKRDLFDITDAFYEVLRQEKLLSLSFKKVNIAIAHKEFTFVPDELFDANRMETYLQTVVSPPINDLIQMDNLNTDHAKNIYTLNSVLKNTLRTQYPSASIQHVMSSTINALSIYVENVAESTNKLFIHIRDQSLQFTCFKQNKFIFANYFEYQSSADIAYYMMLVINQLGIKQGDVRIILSGQIERKSEIFNTLYRYVQKIEFLEYASPYHVPESFDTIPRHVFFDVLTIL